MPGKRRFRAGALLARGCSGKKFAQRCEAHAPRLARCSCASRRLVPRWERMDASIVNAPMSSSSGNQNQCRMPTAGHMRTANAPAAPPMNGITEVETPRLMTVIMLLTCPRKQSSQRSANGMAIHQRMRIHSDIVVGASIYAGRGESPRSAPFPLIHTAGAAVSRGTLGMSWEPHVETVHYRHPPRRTRKCWTGTVPQKIRQGNDGRGHQITDARGCCIGT